MSHVFDRRLAHGYAVAAAGDGSAILDRAGRRHLDARGGASLSLPRNGQPRASGQLCVCFRNAAAMAAALGLAAASARAMRAGA
jgi:hypothetical protein